ncbi:MAG: FxLYD domain-containing protein [Thaumarchaeota archaeon]|nr:FxLYD domain-containing protein [Nitrososphaerota archaeon]
MRIFYTIPVFVLLGILFHAASAEVYIPDNEYAGYFDHDGIYVVYGSVKNTDNQTVLAKVQITVNNGNVTLSESRILPAIYPLKDMPFKFKFPQITSGNPLLQKPQVSFILTNSNPLNIEVNYDRTLVKYPDGHLTGFITNTGNDTVNNIDVYALVHDKNNNYLDEVENTWTIPSLSPGNKTEFVMYPDPAVAKQVYYYSCFIPGADSSVEMSAPWKDKTFYFSVLSIVYFTNQNFDENNNSISFDAANPWQIPYYANFMFPSGSSTGDFTVSIDGNQINPLISKDNDTQNWHVAFNVGYGQHKVVISGFDPNYVPNTDEYFYLDEKSALVAWAGFSTFTISDSKLLDVLGIQGSYVPPWVKNTVSFMIYNNVPPDDVVHEIKYLKQVGVVK